MKPLVIFGLRPGPNTDPARPLFPHTTTGAAANLIKLLGMTNEEYLMNTTRYNVVDNPDDGTLSGRRRVHERMLLERVKTGHDTKFLFLGKEALRAAPLQYRFLEYGRPHDNVMVIPHTSGRSRYYNSLINRTFITQAVRQFIES